MANGGSGEKLIGTNPNARANYFIEDTLEAGIVLTGTEVKSLRMQAPNLRDSFIDIYPRGPMGEAFLQNAHIAPYSHGNIWNHDPLRKRKILLNRREINRLFAAIQQDGYTVVPLRMYFKKGRVKLELGLGKGKKKHDKREDLKKKSAQREMDQARKQRKKS